jgi:hypothetical protein
MVANPDCSYHFIAGIIDCSDSGQCACTVYLHDILTLSIELLQDSLKENFRIHKKILIFQVM